MDSIEEKLAAFAETHKLCVLKRLGFGIHGSVFLMAGGGLFQVSAAKIFEDESPYERERDVYLRLAENEVSQLAGCSVPRLLAHSDALLAIQITVVERPFCLDFAAAYLEGLPDYFPPLDAEWHEAKREQFGDEDWRKVLDVLAELEGLGIYQTDPSPTNISV